MSGENDVDNNHGSWPLANREMAAALKYAGYNHKFVFGSGTHLGIHGASIFPQVFLWLFKSKDDGFDNIDGRNPWLPAATICVAVVGLTWCCCSMVCRCH